MSSYVYRSSGSKRKRSSGANALMLARPFQAPKRSKRTFVPGRDRQAGYYGRYAGAGRTGELKFHDIDVNDSTVTAGGVIQNAGTINIIPQGVTEVQRIGRKCTIRSIHWRYQIQLPEVVAAATPSGPDTLRVMLYLDKQANGATAANTDILEAADFQSYRNLANSSRFVILHDKMHTINYLTLSNQQAAAELVQTLVAHNYEMNLKCTIPIEFDSTTGALTETRSNNLGVMLVGQNGNCGFNSKIRLRFSDN